MIPFNIYGHSKFNPPSEDTPLVWVDYSDSGSWAASNVLGSELVINGTFDTDNDWQVDTDWEISGGTANYNAVSTGRLNQLNSYSYEFGKKYLVKFEIKEGAAMLAFYGNAGGIIMFQPNGKDLNLFQVGTYEFELDCLMDNALLNIYGFNIGGGTSFKIDNISIKEVLSENLTTLMNKGTLGGAMTLNGTVKVANGGFESWSSTDSITRDLGEPFLTDNSFTVALAVYWQDFTSGSSSVLQYPMTIEGDSSDYVGSQNYLRWYKNSTTAINAPYVIASGSGFILGNRSGNPIGLEVSVVSYDVSIGEFNVVNADGTTNNVLNKFFNNIDNTIITLLNRQIGGLNFGANNPLHEFRLYNRAFTLAEMQTLQTELNNKYAGS